MNAFKGMPMRSVRSLEVTQVLGQVRKQSSYLVKMNLSTVNSLFEADNGLALVERERASLPKSDGAGVMVSAMQSREFG